MARCTNDQLFGPLLIDMLGLGQRNAGDVGAYGRTLYHVGRLLQGSELHPPQEGRAPRSPDTDTLDTRF